MKLAVYTMNFATLLCRINSESVITSRPLKLASAFYSVKTQHRRPMKVYSSDGETVIDSNEMPNKAKQKIHSANEIKGVIELTKTKLPNRYTNERSSTTNDEEESDRETNNDKDVRIASTEFTRLGDSDSIFEKYVLKVQSKKQREKSGLIMLEGLRIIQDAISSGVLPDTIFFTQESLIEALEMPPGVVRLYKMPYRMLKKWSLLESPPGIVAFCKIPKNERKQKQRDKTLPLTLICDNVRDPGNLGTILRTVAGVGCSDVLLTKGCTDLWDAKVLRSAAGGHFHIPIRTGLTWEEINRDMDKNASIFIAYHKSGHGSERPEGNSIATIPYFSVNYHNLSDIVVIVGGETEGICSEALQFARYRGGLKINIPLNNKIDSLNVGAAVSTILFEIKRQFIVGSSHIEDVERLNVIS